MKKIFSLVLVILLTLPSSGCTETAMKNAKLPPTRIGSASIQASFGEKYTFETAMTEADVVARIKVGNWIAEDTELHETYYEATVQHCFKGNIPNTFTLLQDGCSNGTLKGYPLFTYGNELLVFLKEATGIEYESPYWIIGSFTTLFDVTYDNSGARYYADRYGIFGGTVQDAVNYALLDELFSEVYAITVQADPIVDDMKYPYPYIFSEEDMTTLLNNQ